MANLLLIVWAILLVIIARWIWGRWLNLLSLYTTVWCACIFAYNLHLIQYHQVEFEVWFYIFVAWIAFYLGSAMVILGLRPKHSVSFPPLNLKRLRYIIVVLSIASVISTAKLASNIVVALQSGNIFEALTESAGAVYGLRFHGEVAGVAYFNFLAYAGCVLAGIYTAKTGKLTQTVFLPIFAVVLDGLVSMQRAGMVFGALLFAFAYYHTPKVNRLYVARWQKIAVVATVLIAFLAVTWSRGAVEGGQIYEGETETLARIANYLPIASMLYFYASGPVPMFSEYLKHPEEDGKDLWGYYIFGSIYRFAFKLGFDTYVPYYQNFYLTPEPINVGTYLREIHRDFGPLGIVLYPAFLGFVTTFLELRGGLVSAIFLTFLYVVIAYSFNINFVGGGGWYIPLPVALLSVLLVRQGSSGQIEGLGNSAISVRLN